MLLYGVASHASPLAMAEWIEIIIVPFFKIIVSVSASDGGVD